MLVAIPGLAVAYLGNNSQHDNVRVKTSPVENGVISTFVSASGNVINRDELTISSPLAGELTKVSVAEGDAVAQGQVLAEFDGRENKLQIDIARAALAFAEQAAAHARLALQRTRQIYDVGGEPRDAVEAAQQKMQGADKDLALARAELRKAELQASQLRVVAPRSGILTAGVARAGAWSRPGEPLFKLAPDGDRAIEIRLDAADAGATKVGKTVTVSSEAYPDRTWTERIIWVAPITNKDSTSNSLAVRLSLGPDAPRLVLGQQVDVKLATATSGPTLTIPAGAVTLVQNKSMVAVAQNGRAHFVPIEIGMSDITRTEVTRGLSAGQQILLAEDKPLKEGDKLDFGGAQGRQ